MMTVVEEVPLEAIQHNVEFQSGPMSSLPGEGKEDNNITRENDEKRTNFFSIAESATAVSKEKGFFDKFKRTAEDPEKLSIVSSQNVEDTAVMSCPDPSATSDESPELYFDVQLGEGTIVDEEHYSFKRNEEAFFDHFF
uniref:Uncharacterized protein n=1 Tax=Ciona savignyi TaxID=51511 RepID=H2YBC4_CIOSA